MVNEDEIFCFKRNILNCIFAAVVEMHVYTQQGRNTYALVHKIPKIPVILLSKFSKLFIGSSRVYTNFDTA